MSRDDARHEAPTRRDYMKYGGAVVGGGLFAGCTGGQGEGTSAEAQSYEVCMEPNGCTTYESVPETFVAYQAAWGEIGFILTGNEPVGLSAPSYYPTYFYDALPGVEFDTDKVSRLVSEDWKFLKERFYEVDPDVILMDNNIAKSYSDWDDGDIAEIEDNVAPMQASYARRPWPDKHEEYPFYTLYECLGKAAEIFQVEEERFDPLKTIYDDLVAQIQNETPDEPLTIGYMNANPAEETFNVWKPALPGYQGEVLRNIGVEDAFAGEYPEGVDVYDTDYEGILEVDPDIIVIKSGMGVHDFQGYESFQAFIDEMAEHPVGSQLSAVQDRQVYAGGSIEHGPVQSLFIHEVVAKQLYPEQLGELMWETYSTVKEIPEEEHLFDRQRVADIINGDI
ncbi:ABC transporter substrate-binding protein [Natronorubrum sp. DTA7]|uniref:ABC transporter substrate-binding protein n=1 Tax=Natronorubrum sp. DTA7 TaxID=3447016 RepID=UPI003F85CF98